MSKGVWHTLEVGAKGSYFQVFWDGKKVIEGHDQTFLRVGKAGLWTKADSVTQFDDLRIE